MDTTQDPDRRVEEARESLLARVEELGRRLHDVREKLDIKSKIAAHPWPAVGIALAAGALLAFPSGSSKRSRSRDVQAAEVKSGLIGAAAATLGTLVFTLVKNVAMHQLSGYARDWWERRVQMEGQPMEGQASRTRDVESFLEH